MSEVTPDGRGRLTLTKEIRERYGERYHIVELHDGIKLIPLDDEPLEDLRAAFAEVDKTATELRQEGRAAVLDEAGH